MKINNQKGILVIQILVYSGIIISLIGGLSAWAATAIKAGNIAFVKEQAVQASEAGIDYYRWHLAHAPTDYQDGTGTAGPYVHNLKDKDGNNVGQFSLNITAPPAGSTLVTITSAGISNTDTNYERTIKSEVAKPSIAKYALAGHEDMRFGEGTEVFGHIHINGGVRFDGLANNIVSSSATTYNDPDHSGGNEIGVHTHVNAPPSSGVNDSYRSAEANPNNIPARYDVFRAGRLISQPTVDFAGFTTDLSSLKTKAQASGGFYRDSAGTGYAGYHVVLKTNDTFDLYKISSWASRGGCASSDSESSSWSVNTQTLQGNYAFPTNGIMFFEDHIVIDGQINTARLTIVAADLPVPSNPSNYKKIIINNDLKYTNYDGTDALGLIAQSGVMVGLISDTDLRIDGALIAQNHKVGRFYYNKTNNNSNCSHRTKSVLTSYGMIASYERYGFAYTDNTGYDTRNIIYDAKLLYAPPPNFPITSDEYQIVSWQEINN